jgi:acetyl-CoA acetyltransferase
MDEWALRSRQNYGKALKAGKFKEEIIPMEMPQNKIEPLRLEVA